MQDFVRPTARIPGRAALAGLALALLTALGATSQPARADTRIVIQTGAAAPWVHHRARRNHHRRLAQAGHRFERHRDARIRWQRQRGGHKIRLHDGHRPAGGFGSEHHRPRRIQRGVAARAAPHRRSQDRVCRTITTTRYHRGQRTIVTRSYCR